MEEKFDGFPKNNLDSEIENQITDHCKMFDIDPKSAVMHFPVLARRVWLKRFLAHTELFRQTLEVPGDIAELGVFRGLGLMTWANLLEVYCVNNRTKIVYGFDNWQGFVKLSKEDGGEIETAAKVIGGFNPGSFRQELENAISIFDSDRFIPMKARVKLIDGNIETTVPEFVENNPGIRFSLIHFDCDLYEPTKAALEALWPRLSRGGVMLFDEYAIHNWPGETKAVDEFFEDKKHIQIKTLPWNNVPAGYIVKPY
jgi:hypothetical protein